MRKDDEIVGETEEQEKQRKKQLNKEDKQLR